MKTDVRPIDAVENGINNSFINSELKPSHSPKTLLPVLIIFSAYASKYEV